MMILVRMIISENNIGDWWIWRNYESCIRNDFGIGCCWLWCDMGGVGDMSEILCSKLICPDGTILHSKHRHDYVDHIDANGYYYFLDGGNDYVRSSLNEISGTYLTITTDDPHSLIREHFVWGTYGKNGDEELRYIILKDMEDEHVEAVLEYGEKWVHIIEIFRDELRYRKAMNIDNLGDL